MSIFSSIKYHYFKLLNELCLYKNGEEIDVEKIKRKHKIKVMFFESFKNNPEYAQEIHKEVRVKDVNVINIKPKVYYENISFWNVTFKNFNLEHVCFHNCRFTNCKFENIKTATQKGLSIIKDPIQGFSCCDFMFCRFDNCELNQLFFSVGTLKCVDFKNVIIQNVVFQMNAFSQVRFVDNCKLYDLFIASPSRMFDISFIENKGKITIDARSAITSFKYKDKVNIDDIGTHKIFKKNHYSNVAATYYSFEQLLSNNFLLDKKSDCYYQRKKAETRSKGFLKAIPSYLFEWFFGYGEYPFRSLVTLLIITILYAPIYMLSGFDTGERIINYVLNCDFFFFWSLQKVNDFFEGLYYSFITLITVGQGDPSPINTLTKIISSSELFLGAILVTTFTATLFRKFTK